MDGIEAGQEQSDSTMKTKQDYEDELNNALQTDIEWSRMKKDDLEQLSMLVDEGLLVEPLMKHIAKDHSTGKLEQMIDDWKPGKFLGGVL